MDIQAFLITEEDTLLFSHITGYSKDVLDKNLGWVIVIDRTRYFPKRYILPRARFDRDYPNVEFYQKYTYE